MSPVPMLSPLLPSPCQSSRAENFLEKNLAIISRACYIDKGLKKAEIAQLVEQRTENPRVRGSNPRLGIRKTRKSDLTHRKRVSRRNPFSTHAKLKSLPNRQLLLDFGLDVSGHGLR